MWTPGKPNQDSGRPLRNSQEETRASRIQENGLWAPAGGRELDIVPKPLPARSKVHTAALSVDMEKKEVGQLLRC